jgi:hypothetical protein
VSEKQHIFEKTYNDYLAQLKGVDLKSVARPLGIRVEGEEALIPFFGEPYRVSARGIIGPFGKAPNLGVSVVLCKYILMCPLFRPGEGDWVSFRDFKDGAPLRDSFMNSAERPVARAFAGRPQDLARACGSLGAREPDMQLSYDVVLRLPVLPRVPLLLLFNDEDGAFPAECKLLFERRAEQYLDMECLVIAGMLLPEYLNRIDRDQAGVP